MLRYIDILNTWRTAILSKNTRDNVDYLSFIKIGVEYLRRDLKRGYCI